MQNKLLQYYFLFSTIFCLFSEAMLGIHFGIMILNIIIFYIFIKQLYISKAIIYVYLFLLLSSALSLAFDTNNLALISKPLAGTFISVFYFYNFYKISTFSLIKIFETYCKAAVIVSFIGILIFVYQMAVGHSDYRLHSIMMEPAHFCGVVLPAFYYYVKSFKLHPYSLSIIALAILLSVSSIGYLGVIICMILLPEKFSFVKNGLAILLALSTGIIAYTVSENVRFRVDDTLSASKSMDVSGVNLSTYALISNVYIVKTVMESNPILGNGFGSHALSHKRNIGNFFGSQFIPVDLRDINATDANSLFLRLLSELGVVGAAVVIYFIYSHYATSADMYVFSRAILVYFFYKLFREGHYYSPEMYFFVLGYFVIYKTSVLQQANNYFSKSTLKLTV